MSDVQAKFQRVKLLLFKNIIRVFGILIYKHFPEAVDYLPPKEVYRLEFEDKKLSRILFNQNHAQVMTEKNIIYELLKIMLYLIMNYRSRRRDNEVLWDVACEIMITRMLRDFSEIALPYREKETTVLIDDLANNYTFMRALMRRDDLDRLTAEMVYKALCDLFAAGKLKAVMVDDKTVEFEIVEEARKLQIVLPPIPANIGEAASEEIKRELRSIYSAIGRGLDNAKIEELLDSLLQVETPWHKILANCLTDVVSQDTQRSWAFINKRLYSYGLLPGPAKSVKPHALFIAVDNSMSISSEDLRKFFSIVNQSRSHFGKIFFVEHSLEINRSLVFEGIEEEASEEIPAELLCTHGRGGTSHRDVFDHLKKLLETQNISLAMFLTDLFSDFEEHYHKVKAEVPMVVIVNSSHNAQAADIIAKDVKIIEMN